MDQRWLWALRISTAGCVLILFSVVWTWVSDGLYGGALPLGLLLLGFGAALGGMWRERPRPYAPLLACGLALPPVILLVPLTPWFWLPTISGFQRWAKGAEPPFFVWPMTTIVFAVCAAGCAVAGRAVSRGLVQGPENWRRTSRASFAAGALISVVATGALVAELGSHLPAGLVQNASASAGALRTIHTAELTYGNTYRKGFSLSLRSLGPPSEGQSVNASGAELIDAVLANGQKSGYVYAYVAGPPDSEGRISAYTVSARPSVFGGTGRNSFYMDQTGVIRYTWNDRAATTTDPLFVQ